MACHPAYPTADDLASSDAIQRSARFSPGCTTPIQSMQDLHAATDQQRVKFAGRAGAEDTARPRPPIERQPQIKWPSPL